MSGEFLQAVREVYAGNRFFWFYAAALVYILIAEKEQRKYVGWPSLILSVLILNPVTYRYVGIGLLQYAYWRLLWLIPVVPVIACAAVSLAGRVKPRAGKVLVCLGMAAVVAWGGRYLYTETRWTSFEPAANAYKITDEAVQVADALLELEDHPRAVVEPGLDAQVRQYSTDIVLFFSRWINTAGNGRKIYESLLTDRPRVKRLWKAMVKYDFDYVVRNDAWGDRKRFEKDGFIPVRSVAGHTIYRIDKGIDIDDH